MAEIEKTEFEFPDEVEVNARKGGKVVEPESDEPEIEVVDDTPPEDRGRKPMTDPPKEVTDDELSKYDESVQKRIKHFTKGYHDERRAKESAEREREEALRFAQFWLKKTSIARKIMIRRKGGKKNTINFFFINLSVRNCFFSSFKSKISS